MGEGFCERGDLSDSGEEPAVVEVVPVGTEQARLRGQAVGVDGARLRLLSPSRDFLFSRPLWALGDVLMGGCSSLAVRSVCPDAQAPSEVGGCCPSGELWKAVLRGRALGPIAIRTGQWAPLCLWGARTPLGEQPAGSGWCSVQPLC